MPPSLPEGTNCAHALPQLQLHTHTQKHTHTNTHAHVRALIAHTRQQSVLADKRLWRRFPELETQLKLLYTAVTRAQHSLYIIETRASVAGTAFFRFLLQLRIAEEQAVRFSGDMLGTFQVLDTL